MTEGLLMKVYHNMCCVMTGQRRWQEAKGVKTQDEEADTTERGGTQTAGGPPGCCRDARRNGARPQATCPVEGSSQHRSSSQALVLQEKGILIIPSMNYVRFSAYRTDLL